MVKGLKKLLLLLLACTPLTGLQGQILDDLSITVETVGLEKTDLISKLEERLKTCPHIQILKEEKNNTDSIKNIAIGRFPELLDFYNEKHRPGESPGDLRSVLNQGAGFIITYAGSGTNSGILGSFDNEDNIVRVLESNICRVPYMRMNEIYPVFPVKVILDLDANSVKTDCSAAKMPCNDFYTQLTSNIARAVGGNRSLPFYERSNDNHRMPYELRIENINSEGEFVNAQLELFDVKTLSTLATYTFRLTSDEAKEVILSEEKKVELIKWIRPHVEKALYDTGA